MKKFINKFSDYYIIFCIYALIGWLYEVLWMWFVVPPKHFINRGVLYGPWLPIYGYDGVIILVLLKKWRKEPIKLFLLSILLCGIIEYGTSIYLELVNHQKYWDYSGYFLNIQGRVCLEGLIVFGLGGCGFTYLLAPILNNFYQRINLKLRNVIAVLLIIVYTIDMTYSTFFNHHEGLGISTNIVETINK